MSNSESLANPSGKSKSKSPTPGQRFDPPTKEENAAAVAKVVKGDKKKEPEDRAIPEVEQSLKESQTDMEYPYIPLSAMNPAPYNPREISEEALAALENSLKTYGLVQPLIWNKQSGNLVGGHQRYRILLKEGAKEVKTCVVDLDEADEMALNLTLNNPEVQGTFNGATLKKLLQSIKSKKSAKEFRESGLEALETHQATLFDVKKNEPTPSAVEEDGPPRDLSYIAPSLRGLVVAINSLKPDPGNVRTHDDRNRITVRNSLERFGQLRPIVVYKGTVMAGNCTWEEMKSLGREWIAVVNVTHLSVGEMVAFGIVDNKSAELAGTNFKKLGEVFRAMDQDWLPFTGYADYEIQPLLAAEWQPPAVAGDAPNAPQESSDRAMLYLLPKALAMMRLAVAHVRNAPDASVGLEVICEHFLSCDSASTLRTRDGEQRADEKDGGDDD